MTTERIDTSTAARMRSGVAAAAALLIVAGGWQIIAGVSALAKDEIYVVGGKYVWQFNLSTWGWIHLITGILLIISGIFILLGQRWAMYTGIVLAALSAIANFGWTIYQPFWALMVIALDVLVIWLLIQRLTYHESLN